MTASLFPASHNINLPSLQKSLENFRDKLAECFSLPEPQRYDFFASNANRMLEDIYKQNSPSQEQPEIMFVPLGDTYLDGHAKRKPDVVAVLRNPWELLLPLEALRKYRSKTGRENNFPNLAKKDILALQSKPFYEFTEADLTKLNVKPHWGIIVATLEFKRGYHTHKPENSNSQSLFFPPSAYATTSGTQRGSRLDDGPGHTQNKHQRLSRGKYADPSVQRNRSLKLPSSKRNLRALGSEGEGNLPKRRRTTESSNVASSPSPIPPPPVPPPPVPASSDNPTDGSSAHGNDDGQRYLLPLSSRRRSSRVKHPTPAWRSRQPDPSFKATSTLTSNKAASSHSSQPRSHAPLLPPVPTFSSEFMAEMTRSSYVQLMGYSREMLPFRNWALGALLDGPRMSLVTFDREGAIISDTNHILRPNGFHAFIDWFTKLATRTKEAWGFNPLIDPPSPTTKTLTIAIPEHAKPFYPKGKTVQLQDDGPAHYTVFGRCTEVYRGSILSDDGKVLQNDVACKISWPSSTRQSECELIELARTVNSVNTPEIHCSWDQHTQLPSQLLRQLCPRKSSSTETRTLRIIVMPWYFPIYELKGDQFLTTFTEIMRCRLSSFYPLFWTNILCNRQCRALRKLVRSPPRSQC